MFDQLETWQLIVNSSESLLRWHEAQSSDPDNDITIIMERAAVAAGREAIAALKDQAQ